MYNYPGQQQQLPIQQQQTGLYNQQSQNQQHQQIQQAQATGYSQNFQSAGVAPQQPGFQQPQQFLSSQITGYASSNYQQPSANPPVPPISQQYTASTSASQINIPNGMYTNQCQ